MRKENLVGQKFGRLLVVNELKPKTGKPKRPQWECECECGTIIIVHRGCDLKSGNTNSCGCLKSDVISELASKRNFDNRKYEPRIATAKKVYDGDYNDGDLTFEKFLEISQQNCHYCNAPPSNIRKDKHKNSSNFYIENSEFIYSGLDRVNSEYSHMQFNIVPCCKWCNYAKRERTVEEFTIWAEALYVNLQKKKVG